MNFKQIYRTLEQVLPDLILNKHDYSNSVSYDHIFIDLDRFKRAFRIVQFEAGFLVSEDIQKQLNPILTVDSNQMTAYKNVAVPLINTANQLYLSVVDFVRYLETNMMPEINESSIDVKLIHIQNLDDLEKAANLLKRSFNTPVLYLDGEVTLEDVETGSLWLTLGIIATTGVALKLCANMIWAALAIKNKIKEMEYHERYLRRMDITNNYIEGLMTHHVDLLNRIREAEAQHIIGEFLADKNSPDMVAQIKGSVDAIGSLIDKGAEFYPSIKAADEVKMLFPDFSIKELLESKIKLLSEGKTDKPE